MPDQGLKVDIARTFDAKEIQKMADQLAVNILVGFPSGRQHVPTVHKKETEGKNGRKKKEFAGYDGESPEAIKSIETADLALELHYGSARTPARPFLEDGINSQLGNIKKAFQAEAQKANNGGQPNWSKVGTMAVGAVQEFVRGDYYKENIPNSQTTIDYKGSDRPLIDSGDLLNSLTFVVQKGANK